MKFAEKEQGAKSRREKGSWGKILKGAGSKDTPHRASLISLLPDYPNIGSISGENCAMISHKINNLEYSGAKRFKNKPHIGMITIDYRKG